jgi:hypothetical protein
MTCEHINFECYVKVNRLEDTGQFCVDMNVNCLDCGIPFEFLGLQPGLDLQGATCSLDALEAHLAIIPKGLKPNPLHRMAFKVNRFDG